jgi:DHA1 family bicyclomycin/chloramphenicol resistance-like MFS transporter
MPGAQAIATDGRRSIGRVEFIALMALLMSIAALSVDLMLPAMGAIREEFGLEADSTAVAGLVTSYVLGLALSQLVYGVLADRYGRKPLIYAGLAIYLIGASASVFAPSLGFLLVARFIWGLGAAGPRVLTLSVVRDTHEGSEMAKVMSFILAVFILIPAIAPSIGAVLTDWISWRGTFGFAVVVTLVVGVWSLRLPETLKPEHRREIGFRNIVESAKLVVTNRVTSMLTLALSVLFGAFISYIASSELIFTEVFDSADTFPLIFGGVALVMGVGMLANSWLVGRFGLTTLIHLMVVGYVAAATSLAALALATDGRPGLWVFVLGLALLVLFQSLLIPNLNTVAMIPMGAVAGIASAIIGTVSTGLAAAIGAYIDQLFDGTVTPLGISFAVASWLTFLAVRLAKIEDVAERPTPEGAEHLDATLRTPAVIRAGDASAVGEH